MRRTGRKKEWSIVLFCAALLVLFPPVLSIFDKPILTASGIPTAFVVLYGFWSLIIIGVAYGAMRRSTESIPPLPPKTPPAQKGDT